MQSQFFEQQLVSTGYSIVEQVNMIESNDQTPLPKERKLSKETHNHKSGESLGLISGASSMNKMDINMIISRGKAG